MGGVRPLLDISWYLDAPDDVREERLVLRHVAGGRPPHDAVRWVADVDGPNATTIKRTATQADFTTDAFRSDRWAVGVRDCRIGFGRRCLRSIFVR